MKKDDLKGKVVAITGGAGVLCSTMAQALAGAGADVAVLDLRKEAADAVAGSIEKDGGKALGVGANVLDKDSLEQARKTIEKTLGPTDILINGAGGNKKESTTSEELSFFDLPADAVRWVFELNLIGTLLPCQVFGREMAARKQGIILNVSSMSAFRPLTRVPAYSAAKAAISNSTQWLAVHMSQEYAPEIRVNAIAPGFFLTEQNRFLLTEKKTGDLTPRGKKIIDHTPMAKFGDPEDLIGCVEWLLSPSASFVHGAVIPIDGGFAAYSGV